MAEEMDKASEFIRVASLTDVPPGGSKPISVAGRHIALFNDGGRIYAVDNRCPHMAYPLTEGTVTDGILRCHWHHWRFDLCSGGCFTSGGDDVATFGVEVRDGEIWVSPVPRAGFHSAIVEKGRADLEQGIREGSSFLIAKAVAVMDGAGVEPLEMIRLGALRGIEYRQQGFGRGLVTLTCTANLLKDIDPSDRVLALVHGLTHVARDAANQPPRRPQRALPEAGTADFSKLLSWFRSFIEDRESAGAERCLRSAIASGEPPERIAKMLVTAATDHFFLSIGHVVDFVNKGFELVGHLGEAQAATVLSSIIPLMASAFRHEESVDWQEMVGPLHETFEELPQLLAEGQGLSWRDEDELLACMLRERPLLIIEAVREAIKSGATLRQVSAVLARAGIRRVLRFHLQNEGDWDTVLHVVSYANGLDNLVRWLAGRDPEMDRALWRGVFHGAMFVYLTHFLNIPAARLPNAASGGIDAPDEPQALCERLAYCAEFQQVDEAALIVHHYQKRGYRMAPLLAALGRSLLKEDSDFHTFQMVEAAFRQHALLGSHPDAAWAVVAGARYLTAQKLRRSMLATTENAVKLARGERIDI